MADPTVAQAREWASQVAEAWNSGETDAKQLYRATCILLAALDRQDEERARGLLAQRPPLPERDTSKPTEKQGLFRKFDVHRVDEGRIPGKHSCCEYFVLDTECDPCAKAALATYAVVVEKTHPRLADDIRRRYGLPAPGPVNEEAPDE